jgi:hypothetical protein
MVFHYCFQTEVVRQEGIRPDQAPFASKRQKIWTIRPCPDLPDYFGRKSPDQASLQNVHL